MTMQDDNTELAVRIRGLHKSFDLKNPDSGVLGVLTGKSGTHKFEALKDIDLDIQKGEVLGIIGRNGAGKSTLLKLISGVLTPTSGTVEVFGRVAAILELGTGFHPERTGRENIFVGGMYMGFTRAELENKIDQIIAFANIGEFIDQPLKTFSTGMVSRLAFSLGTAVEADILIVDETLSVGDAGFERKCFAHFDKLRASGKTILFVTHYSALIEMVCDQGIYIDERRIKAKGNPKEVNAQYMRDLFGTVDSSLDVEHDVEIDGAVCRRYGNGLAQIIDYGLFDKEGKRVNRVKSGETYCIKSKAICNTDQINTINLGLNILTTQGVNLFSVNPIMARIDHIPFRRGETIEASCDIVMNLGAGDYFITIGAWSNEAETHYDRLTDALHFVVTGDPVLENSLVNLSPRYTLTKSSGADAKTVTRNG